MNKAILMGRLTKDPELRYTSTNMAVCNFTIAINRRFSKQGEEKQADFIPIVAFDKTAEFCGKYYTKGRLVAIVVRYRIVHGTTMRQKALCYGSYSRGSSFCRQ
jgi:single-strand DNA-binding protein